VPFTILEDIPVHVNKMIGYAVVIFLHHSVLCNMSYMFVWIGFKGEVCSFIH